MSVIDARGMSCPQPVLMAKKAIASKLSAVEILVDSSTARNNVERFLNSQGYTCEISESGEEFTIKAKK